MPTVELKLTARETVELPEGFTEAKRIWLSGEGSDKVVVNSFYPDNPDLRTWKINHKGDDPRSAGLAVVDMIPTPGGELRALTVLYAMLNVEHEELLKQLTFHLEY